jgi:hypothetical protein
MVELEPIPFGATPAALVDVGAAFAVALAHGAPDGGGDVARGRGGVGARELRARSASLGVAPGFDPLELFGDRCFDDGREVAAGDLGPHESLEPLELAVELGAGGELDFVAVGRERLDDRES